MMDTIEAYGLRDPNGKLTAFATHKPEGAWAVLAHLFGREETSFKRALIKKGWEVIPVTISSATEPNDGRIND